MADVARGWVETWAPRADAAVQGLAALFEQAPKADDASAVVARVDAQRRELLDACGL
jgi:hypothetical protein